MQHAVDAADRLSSWKEVAAYLGCSVATAQRWERLEGLPIHRHVHAKLGSILASRSEIDRWGAARGRTKVPAGKPECPALAVLPFDNLTGEPSQEYLADGFTDELITELGRRYCNSLALIARTSVMRYKGTNEPVNRIGQELGVQYVLEGSLRRVDSRVRIAVQLIETRQQTHLWAECFEAELGDLFAVQRAIALQAAAKIGVRLTGEAGGVRTDPEAHELYLKGRFHWFKLTAEGMDAALRYYELALQRDPCFAAAHAGVSAVWQIRGDSGFRRPLEVLPRAKEAALKAVELAPESAIAHANYGYLLLSYEWDFEGALRQGRLAATLNPSDVDAQLLLWESLASMRRYDESEPHILRCLQLDPCNPFFQCFYGWHLLFRQRFEQAVRQLRKAAGLDPKLSATRLALWGAFYRQKKFAEAIGEACRFFELRHEPDMARALRRDYRQYGYLEAMKRAANELAAQARTRYIGALRVARLYAHAGDKGRAFEWLQEAVDERTPAIAHLEVSWDWVQLRSDIRFRRLLRQIRPPRE